MKGVPFREAHGIVGRIVSFCIQNGKELTGLTLREFRRFYPGIRSGTLPASDGPAVGQCPEGIGRHGGGDGPQTDRGDRGMLRRHRILCGVLGGSCAASCSWRDAGRKGIPFPRGSSCFRRSPASPPSPPRRGSNSAGRRPDRPARSTISGSSGARCLRTGHVRDARRNIGRSRRPNPAIRRCGAPGKGLRLSGWDGFAEPVSIRIGCRRAIPGDAAASHRLRPIGSAKWWEDAIANEERVGNHELFP